MSRSTRRSPRQGRRDGGERVAEAQPGQGAVDLVVEVDGARLRIDRLPALQHEALDAVLGEQCRGGQPVGPAPTMITGTFMASLRTGREVGGDQESGHHGGSQVAWGVPVAEVGDEGTDEQEQQPGAGDTADHGSRDADQDPGCPGDLEGSDRPVGRDGEPEVGGPDPHRGQGEDLRGARARRTRPRPVRRRRAVTRSSRPPDGRALGAEVDRAVVGGHAGLDRRRRPGGSWGCRPADRRTAST